MKLKRRRSSLNRGRKFTAECFLEFPFINEHNVIIYLAFQGTVPIAVIPEVLEKAVTAVVHSLDKQTAGGLNMIISTTNLGIVTFFSGF